MEELGEERIWKIIREELEKKIKKRIKTEIDQEIQLDWSKIEKS